MALTLFMGIDLLFLGVQFYLLIRKQIQSNLFTVDFRGPFEKVHYRESPLNGGSSAMYSKQYKHVLIIVSYYTSDTHLFSFKQHLHDTVKEKYRDSIFQVSICVCPFLLINL